MNVRWQLQAPSSNCRSTGNGLARHGEFQSVEGTRCIMANACADLERPWRSVAASMCRRCWAAGQPMCDAAWADLKGERSRQEMWYLLEIRVATLERRR